MYNVRNEICIEIKKINLFINIIESENENLMALYFLFGSFIP